MTPRAVLALRRRSTVTLAPNHDRKPLATVACSVSSEDGSDPRAGPRACKAFDKISHGGAASGSDCTLFEYARKRLARQAIDHFLDVYSRRDRRVGAAALSCVLKVCGSVPDRVLGEQLHCVSVRTGHDRGDVSVGTSLVDLYMKCCDAEDASKLFEGMPERNVVTWTSLINGYVQAGAHSDVMALFFRMRAEGIWSNPFTFTSVLSAVASHGAPEVGRRVHAQSVKFGCRSTVFVRNSLMNMYAKCGLVEEAKAVFSGMEARDRVSWNTLMAGLLLNGCELEALQLFHDSRSSKGKLTQSIYCTVIKLCVNLKQLGVVWQLHSCVSKHGFLLDGNVMTTLMDAYSKCGELDDALSIFLLVPGSQNIVSWTAMINGSIQNGDIPLAAALFNKMRKNGVDPNEFTYSIMLTASVARLLPQIHAQVIKTNYHFSPTVGTALLSSYSKHCSTEESLSIFNMINQKDVVAWSAMLTCYAQAGDSDGATNVFVNMARQGLKANEFTISSVIDACAIDACACPAAGVDQGRQFHAISIKYRYQDAICVSSALVSMYARKGSIESAQSVFLRQTDRDLVSWNSMISGYS